MASLMPVKPGAEMAVIEATQENFEQLVTGNNMAILDFWAPWCGPCRSFAPVFEAAAAKHPDIAFVKVNTEEQQGLDRKSTRLNSSHGSISYAGFCLKTT